MLIGRDPERGATAILVAGSLVLLMGFAAVAIDGGLALNERRQDQSAADAGALSAAISARVEPVQPGCAVASPSGSIEREAACNGAVVAIEVIDDNLSVDLEESDFADTTRCPDTAFPTEFHDTSANSPVIPRTDSNELVCIRFNRNMSKVHILLPIVEVPTTFGRILGRNSIGVSARAEVELFSGQLGSILPFAIGPSAADGPTACVFEPGSGLDDGPCGGPSDGNFGYLLSYLYGSQELGTPTACGGGGGFTDGDRIAASIAKGSDHFFLPVSIAGGVFNDRDECPNSNQPISEVDVRTGGFSSAAEDGFFNADILGTEGRLLCKGDSSLEPEWLDPPWDSDGECVDVNSQLGGNVDDLPLWEFLESGITEVASPGACSGVASVAQMSDCLTAWRDWIDADGIPDSGDEAHTETLFSSEIATGTRFGWVPLLDGDPASGGSGFYEIEEFLPVYLNTTYFKCSGGGSSCEVIHTPGTGSSSSTGPCSGVFEESCGLESTGNKGLDGATAYVMTRDMLPQPIADFPNNASLLRYNLSQ